MGIKISYGGPCRSVQRKRAAFRQPRAAYYCGRGKPAGPAKKRRDITLKEMFLLDKSVRSRSISPENPTGTPGGGARAVLSGEELKTHPARELGEGWKVRPCITIPAGERAVLADIEGPGVIGHIWCVHTSKLSSRNLILRMCWEGSAVPSVEVPYGDFFFQGWDGYWHVNSAAVAVNAARGYNCFWEMPFRRRARIELENRSQEPVGLFYQIDYRLCELSDSIGYFHAVFRRSNPLDYKTEHTVLENVRGAGKYVGTYLAYGSHSSGWWGEGEIKFFLDGDARYPTICGTGTEDYFLAAYNFENWETHAYENFSSLYSGFHAVGQDGLYKSQARFGMYRLHLPDPVYFARELRVTLQSLGWKSRGRFHPQRDDLATTAFFYLDAPLQAMPPFPVPDETEFF